MRKSREETARTRERILDAASEEIRANGVAGSGLAGVMKAAGLTHGGFYKHFGAKDQLVTESLNEAFEEMADRLAQAGKQSQPGTAWKAIVKTYLSPEHCDHAECGCPLAALAPELARVDTTMKAQILGEMTKYKSRMLPFMPGRRAADKERAFFVIFSTMVGAIEMARVLPEPGMRAKV